MDAMEITAFTIFRRKANQYHLALKARNEVPDRWKGGKRAKAAEEKAEFEGKALAAFITLQWGKEAFVVHRNRRYSAFASGRLNWIAFPAIIIPAEEPA